MSRPSRSSRAILVALLATAAAVVLATPARADCDPDGSVYPPGSCGIGLSATSVIQGEDLTATGVGFSPGEAVRGTVFSDPIPLGTENADQRGTVSFLVETDGLSAGTHTVTMDGASGVSLSSSFTVLATGGGSGGDDGDGGGTAGGDDELPFTGAGPIVPIGLAGLALLLVGGLAVLLSRRSAR